MYVWVWRHLPFGRPGKIVGSLLLITLAVALLWYVVFPWAEPLLPFDDVQVTDDDGVPGGAGVGHEVPYSTETNNPDPSPSR
jgi:hypothetical protein